MDFAVKVLPPKTHQETRTDEATGATTEVEVTRPAMTLQLWDIAGHERFGSMTRVYYKNAIAAVVVFDVQRPATLDAVQKWKEDVDSKVVLLNGNRIPCVLLANKVDLVDGDAGLDRAGLDRFAEDNGFVAWFATSALSNTNVDAAMERLADAIAAVAAENAPQEPERDIIIPSEQPQDDTQEKKGCCSR